uniref:Gustatory receptor n=1 Tax=Tetranychus urticae TaxID=32264 RepID=T1L2U2_TETUR
MTSINRHQCFLKNEDLKNYPKISINSIPSRYKLMISSTNGALGKCLFILIALVLNMKYLNFILAISSDPGLSVLSKSAVCYALIDNIYFIFLHFNYNHEFFGQIEDYWNELQINFDYETRKYFWTQQAISRLFTLVTYTSYIAFNYIDSFYGWYTETANNSSKDSFIEDVFHYVLQIIVGPVSYFNKFCQTCIFNDILILAQTALLFSVIKLKKLYIGSVRGKKILNIDVITDLRHKYLSTHRLVEKINEIMSPCLLIMFIHFTLWVIHLSYALLFLDVHQLIKFKRIIQCVIMLMILVFMASLAIRVHIKSQELLMTVYKLSLKTDSIRILSEMTLFLNYNEIGLSFGGLFMLTTSSLSTLFSILTTIVIAIPSFNKHEDTD